MAKAPPSTSKKSRNTPPKKSRSLERSLLDGCQKPQDRWSLLILSVVEAVATSRSVKRRDILSEGHSDGAIQSAQELAMAACCASGIPLHKVSRAFGTTWAIVFAAEEQCRRQLVESEEFQREWESLHR